MGVRKMELDAGTKPAVTPGVKREEEAGDDLEMSPHESTEYRSIVARANYLAQDRSDIQYAVKELCRNMSCPTRGDWKVLKRLSRYLLDKVRARTLYKYQTHFKRIQVWVDTDYAGCKRTRKSTSGGVIMLGEHAIKTWSVTQAVIALSSGEAEYYGIVKGASAGLGVCSVLADLGVVPKTPTRLVIHTDSSARRPP